MGNLAKIGLNEKEVLGLQKDLGKILGFVSKLKKAAETLDVDKEISDLKNILRKDENPHESGKYTEALLKEAPETVRGYVKVKKII